MTNDEKCKELEARFDALEAKLSRAVQSGDEAAGRIGCEAYAVLCELDEAERCESDKCDYCDEVAVNICDVCLASICDKHTTHIPMPVCLREV